VRNCRGLNNPNKKKKKKKKSEGKLPITPLYVSVQYVVTLLSHFTFHYGEITGLVIMSLAP
jgi:hypothetical protein